MLDYFVHRRQTGTWTSVKENLDFCVARNRESRQSRTSDLIAELHEPVALLDGEPPEAKKGARAQFHRSP